MAKLKRASGKTPLALSSATGYGVEAVLMALLEQIGEAKKIESADTVVKAWQP